MKGTGLWLCLLVCISILTTITYAESSQTLVIASDSQTQWLSNDGTWKPVSVVPVNPSWAADVQVSNAQWIWPYTYVNSYEKGGPFKFKRVFTIPENAKNIQSTLVITVDDNIYSVKINGKDLGLKKSGHYNSLSTLVTELQPGINVLEFIGENNVTQAAGIDIINNPAGAIFKIDIRYDISSQSVLTPSSELSILNITKTASPKSIKRGQQTTIKIELENTGISELNDIEISDPVDPDFEFISGETQARYARIKPGESRYFQYTVQSISSGKFDLGPAIIQYADKTGNYSVMRSNSPIIEVMLPLTSLTPAKSLNFPMLLSLISLFFMVLFFRKGS